MLAIINLFAVIGGPVAVIFRLRNYWTRGSLVALSGANSRKTLFAWLAALSLLTSLLLVEAARRIAEAEPVHIRIRQLLQRRHELLESNQLLLNQQRASLESTPPDLQTAAKLAETIRQQREESEPLKARIDQKIALEEQILKVVLPTRTDLRASLADFKLRLRDIPRQPWQFLTASTTVQLSLAVLTFFNGLVCLRVATGRQQVRAHGLWQAEALVRWRHCRAYH